MEEVDVFMESLIASKAALYSEVSGSCCDNIDRLTSSF